MLSSEAKKHSKIETISQNEFHFDPLIRATLSNQKERREEGAHFSFFTKHSKIFSD